jgi:internalin A
MSGTIKNIVKLVIIFMALTASEYKAFGQTYTLPDTNFRNVLMSRYPSVMTGDKLNITAAGNFIFDLILTNADITDLSGIEYFKSVFKIDASMNKIVKVPDLSPITNLQYLFLNSNHLESVDFVSKNANLLQLQFYYNKLTSFPELPYATKLQKLFLSGNQLTHIPGLNHLVNLENLQLSVNKFDSLPDISGNLKLTELHCDRNRLSNLSGTEYLPNLKIIYCWGNQINDLSHLNNNTSLEELYADYNLLKTLPVISNKPYLRKISVSYNKLMFDELLPLTEATWFKNFSYAPQDSIGENVEKSVRFMDSVSLAVTVDTTSQGNVYAWYKEGELLEGVSVPHINFEKAELSDAGDYIVAITNPALPQLTLYHKSIRLKVNNSCMDVLSYGYKLLSQDCREGTGFRVEVSTEGAQSPVAYFLNIPGTSDTIKSVSGIFSNIPAGTYMLRMKDQRGCRVLLDTDLTVYRPSDCDPVIAPLEGGQQSSYFVDKPGVARILDMNGNVIREFIAPAIWDGTTSGGEVVSTGYYVITIDNKKLTNITVVR